MYQPANCKEVAAKERRSVGRPLSMSARRQVRSITLDPGVIQEFISWTDKNALSFSRGVEEAMRAWIKGGKNGTDF